MSPYIRTITTIAITAATTFALSAYFFSHRNNALKLTFVEMQAFNDINRVENYDTLEQLIINGCSNDALSYVRIQQQSLLSGINDYFIWGDTVKNFVRSRNEDIYARALKSLRPAPYTTPTC